MRVVSFLPCATEIACVAGLEEALVGISHECDYPASLQMLPHVTSSKVAEAESSQAVDAQVRDLMASGKSLYAIDREALKQLEPDLVLTQGLCDVCAVSEDDVRQVLDNIGSRAELLSLNPMSLEDVLESIQEVGAAAGSSRTAEAACRRLESRVAMVREESGCPSQPGH
ncbi:MAG: cobalamin-binding protein, partial [Planctomycetota bacterium]